MGLLKKKYEKSLIAEELNTLLQEELNTYLQDTELDILGSPLPKASEKGLDWDADTMEFGFELGLAPQFEVNLKALKKVTHYQIDLDAKMIEHKIKYYQKLFGELISQKEVKEGLEITAQFTNEAVELDVVAIFTLKDVKNKEAKKSFWALR